MVAPLHYIIFKFSRSYMEVIHRAVRNNSVASQNRAELIPGWLFLWINQS